MVDTAIRRMTLAGREAHRSERGANRIPAVWRGTVVFVRAEDSASGARAGVYVRVPRLVGEQTLGPLPVVGTAPVVGDRVLVVAVEGRRDQLMILNPPAGVPDDLLDRLDTVETKADVLRADVDALDQALQQVLPRLDDVEGVADDAAAAAGQAQSTANRALVLAGDNVLEDPSFETSLWFDQFNNHGNQRYAFEPSGGPRTGDQAMAITRDDDATVAVNYPFDAADVEADESWRLSIWYRTEGEINLDQGLGTRLRILIAGTNDALAASVELEPSEEYQRVVVTFAVPPGIDQVSPALRVSHTQGTLIVDDVSFQQVGAAAEALELAESNADAIAAIPGIDIDTSAGTRVMIGDHTIHYDSGWRDITGMLNTGQWSPSTFANGGVFIRRVNSTVSLSIRIQVSDDPSTTSAHLDNSSNALFSADLPEEWTPRAMGGASGVLHRFNDRYQTPVTWNFARNPRLNFRLPDGSNPGPWVPGEALQGANTYMVDAPYPTTLPGTPA